MNTPRSVVVIGAGLAGHATARALRKEGFDGRISIIGDEPERPYDRPPLSKEYLAGTMSESELSLEGEGEDLNLDWVLGSEVTGLDVAERTILLADGRRIDGEAVVVATGSRARRLEHQLSGVHTIRTLSDARALKSELVPGARVAVIGAGFIGAEIASTIHKLGLDVTVIEAAPAPLAGPLGIELGAAVAALHTANGVDLRCGVGVSGLTGVDRVTGVILADGSEVAADVVIAGIGATPAIDWLAGSGLDLYPGLVASSVGQTAAPGIWTVGDCSAWYDEHKGTVHRVEHWTDSRDRPQVLARALLGEPSGQLRAPYFWSDQYGVRIQFAGRRHGDETVEIETGSAQTRDLLAVYRRDGDVVAVLGMNQPKLFTRHRKSLPSASVHAVPVAV